MAPKAKTPPSSIGLEETVGLAEEFVLTVREAGTGAVVGQRTGNSEGRSSGVDFEGERAVVHAAGRPTTNETGVERVVQRIASHLASAGSIPAAYSVRQVNVASDVDVELTWVGGQPARQFQVRRVGDEVMLRTLGKSRAYREEKTVEALAETLAEAVNAKIGKQYSNPRLELAIDALDVEATYATSVVIEAFLARHADRVRNRGFRAIWLVGPTSVTRLDA